MRRKPAALVAASAVIFSVGAACFDWPEAHLRMFLNSSTREVGLGEPLKVEVTILNYGGKTARLLPMTWFHYESPVSFSIRNATAIHALKYDLEERERVRLRYNDSDLVSVPPGGTMKATVVLHNLSFFPPDHYTLHASYEIIPWTSNLHYSKARVRPAEITITVREGVFFAKEGLRLHMEAGPALLPSDGTMLLRFEFINEGNGSLLIPEPAFDETLHLVFENDTIRTTHRLRSDWSALTYGVVLLGAGERLTLETSHTGFGFPPGEYTMHARYLAPYSYWRPWSVPVWDEPLASENITVEFLPALDRNH